MNNYIKAIRALVGHRPIILCGASVIVENEKGEILLQRRSDNGTWGYAGGCVELDEAVEDAARRELHEETGLIADELSLFGVFSGKGMHYTYPNGDEVSIIDIVFVCKKYHGELRADAGEVQDLRFFSYDAVPDNLSPPVAGAIHKYISEDRLGGHIENC